jgi:two-component system, chemotaxis family, protein-glutamate methylesterase/glutaminase
MKPHRKPASPPTATEPASPQSLDELRDAGGSGRFDLVTIAASAGGIGALGTVLSGLPADFPIPIAVVQHRTSVLPNLLATVLGRRTTLRVKQAEQSELLQAGTVYLAPPDLHLSVLPNRRLYLSDGRLIRFVRSSANPLFASAAEALGGRVLGVILTGKGRDGTDGVQAVYEHGGTVIAQDEESSEYFSMPHSAIETGCISYVLPLKQIAHAISTLVLGDGASHHDDSRHNPKSSVHRS